MATLEDRILGEKLHYYCSSSESEGDEEDDDGDEKTKTIKNEEPPLPVVEEYSGTSTNTGPKGVLKDWQRFKQLETENRREQEKEKMQLAKKLAMSCMSHNDEEKAKNEMQQGEINDEDSLIDEAILQQYIAKRLDEMHASVNKTKSFGYLLHLSTTDQFLECIDSEEKCVTIIIHLYEDSACGCEAMNGCLKILAEERKDVKFCRIKASVANVSSKFRGSGLPALLVYKSGQMIGNFVRLIDEFGDDFYATDVESFLIQHGMLDDSPLDQDVSKIRCSKRRGNYQSDSSDDD